MAAALRLSEIRNPFDAQPVRPLPVENFVIRSLAGVCAAFRSAQRRAACSLSEWSANRPASICCIATGTAGGPDMANSAPSLSSYCSIAGPT